MNNDLHLKSTYLEILDGYSLINSKNLGIFYYKHQTVRESILIDKQRDVFIRDAILKGIPTSEEREEDLIKNKIWDKDKNLQIFGLKESLSRLHITKTKVFQTDQIDAVNREILSTEKQLKELEQEKFYILGLTAEILANARVNDFFLKDIFFKDRKLENKLFSNDEFNDLDNDQIKELQGIFESVINNFNDKNIRTLSISSVFLTSFTLSNNAYEFFGLPILNLTIFQNQLYKWGMYFKHLVTHCESEIPENVLIDPDKLEEFCSASKNAKDVLDKKSPGSMLVGKNSIGSGDNSTINSLIEKAKKKGGNLEMGDVFNLN